jgi:hypothetical protein
MLEMTPKRRFAIAEYGFSHVKNERPLNCPFGLCSGGG